MTRPVDGRVIAGVALAVANRLGLSPGAVRLIWFISVFFGGIGVLLYIAGWLLIPEEEETHSIAEEVTGRVGDLTTWLGVGLIAIATIILVSEIGWVRSDLLWAVALLAVGVLLYRGHLGTWTGGAEPTDGQGPEGAVRSLVDSGDTGTESSDAGSSTEDPEVYTAAPPVRRRRERSILARLTVGTIFIVIGSMFILDTADLIRPAFSHYVAVAVAIVGGGLIIGSVYGRSRGLIGLGFLLVPIMLASSVVTSEFDGGWGDPVYRPASVSEIDPQYQLTGGDLEIDLGRVDLGDEVVEIDGDLGFGRLLVLVPEGVGLDLRAHVGFGDVNIFGDHNGGVDIDRRLQFDGTGRYILDLDVGFGEVDVREVGR